MGYQTGCTAVPGVLERERHELMGRHAVVQRFAVYGALSRLFVEFVAVASLTYAAPAAVPQCCLLPLSRSQLHSMCPWALQHYESMGWELGAPVGDARQGGLAWFGY
jgi:hypothetical protein